MKKIEFVGLSEGHFPLLYTWYNTPHLKDIYAEGRNWFLDEIKNKYLPRIEGKEKVNCYLISLDGQPIGLTQYYCLADFPRSFSLSVLKTYCNINKTAAIDLFIGEKDLLGKGLGSVIINQFLEDMVFNMYNACLVDPDLTNIRAIKAYEKSRFKLVETIKDDKGIPIALMIKEKE